MQRKNNYDIEWDIKNKECAKETEKLNAVREEFLDSVSSSEKQKLSNKHKRYREYQEICVKSAIESRNRDENPLLNLNLQVSLQTANMSATLPLGAGEMWVGHILSTFIKKLLVGFM